MIPYQSFMPPLAFEHLLIHSKRMMLKHPNPVFRRSWDVWCKEIVCAKVKHMLYISHRMTDDNVFPLLVLSFPC
jgi:hypothetical protein